MDKFITDKGREILRSMFRVRAFSEKRSIRRSPLLRSELHEHALVLVPYFYKDTLLALALGTLGEEPQLILCPNNTDPHDLQMFSQKLQLILSEYYARAHEGKFYPQILLPDHDVVGPFISFTKRLVEFSLVNNFSVDSIRHVGRLLAYPFIDRLGFPGQQSLVILTDILDDHYAFPFAESFLNDLYLLHQSLLNNTFSSGVPLVNYQEDVYNRKNDQIIFDRNLLLHLEKLDSNSSSFLQDMHILKNMLAGWILPRFSYVSALFLHLTSACPRRCQNVQDLNDREVIAFKDYMTYLHHHFSRLRRVDGVERDTIDRHFISFWDRPFSKVKRSLVGRSTAHAIDVLACKFDPVRRSEYRINGMLLSVVIERIQGQSVFVTSPTLSASIGINTILDGIEGGEGTVRDVSDTVDGIRLHLDWIGILPSVGFSYDFLIRKPQEPDISFALIIERLGKKRGGEPWTHQSSTVQPASTFKPYQENLVDYLRKEFS